MTGPEFSQCCPLTAFGEKRFHCQMSCGHELANEWASSCGKTPAIYQRRLLDLFYVITSKLDILVGHSRQILGEASSTIVKVLNMTVIVCQLGGPFSGVFP